MEEEKETNITVNTNTNTNTNINNAVNNSFFVYLLQSDIKKNTYVGATVNLDRRLRQHNKIIKGGAIYTTSKVVNGETWDRIVYISGFPTWNAALQFEWKWKNMGRKIKIKDPLEKRMLALKQLLSLNQSTRKSIPFSLWSTKPTINVESILFKPFANLFENNINININNNIVV